jgi:hypothetical protein
MVVKDREGVSLGRISRIGRTSDGHEAVEVNIDGQNLNLAIVSLTVSPSGKEVMSSMTKADILAAAPR